MNGQSSRRAYILSCQGLWHALVTKRERDRRWKGRGLSVRCRTLSTNRRSFPRECRSCRPSATANRPAGSLHSPTSPSLDLVVAWRWPGAEVQAARSADLTLTTSISVSTSTRAGKNGSVPSLALPSQPASGETSDHSQCARSGEPCTPPSRLANVTRHTGIFRLARLSASTKNRLQLTARLG